MHYIMHNPLLSVRVVPSEISLFSALLDFLLHKTEAFIAVFLSFVAFLSIGTEKKRPKVIAEKLDILGGFIFYTHT